MKIEQLKGKKLVGHYDIDEKCDLSPYYPIAKIEYFWGHFVIIGNGRGFRCSFTEEQFFNWCLLAGWESERTTIGLSHEPSWTRFWTALRVRGTAAGLDVLEEWTQRIEGHTRLFHAQPRRAFHPSRVQETWRQRKGIAAAKGVAGALSKHGQDSGRLGYFFGYLGKKIKKLKVDIQRIRQGFAYPLVFY